MDIVKENEELKRQNKKMREALEHALKVFRSMSNRGAYPKELCPFKLTPIGVNLTRSGPPEKESAFLGKQGFMFIIEALDYNGKL